LKNSIISLIIAFSLSACGGSDEAPTNDVIVPPVPSTPAQIIQADNDISLGQSVDLALLAQGDAVTNIQWQQTAGEPITFYAANSKVIGFTPATAGEYQFSVDFTRNNQPQSLSYDFTVKQQSQPLTARLGHAVLEGNKVSLMAGIAETVEQSSIKWNQTAGPNVVLTETDTNGDIAIYFEAPSIVSDTIIEFELSAEVNGSVLTDKVIVLVENVAEISSDASFTDRLATVFAYKSDSPYANSIVNCVYANTITSENTCRMSTLPLIAQDTISPSVDDIMDRVVVSHDWMGKRFQEFLENYDVNNDFKNLLRATTAVVISYDVRPSFYWALTGAIYLDASNFWLTPEERDTINQAPDYRAAFGNDLQFVMPWRYVKNNDYVSRSFPIEQRQSREAEDGLYSLAALMYHELAHANDFFPSSLWSSISSSDRILEVVNDIGNSTGFQSNLLSESLPLNGNEMRSLAQVRFQGDTASAQQKAYLPDDISNFFSAEDAPHFYNYSSIREDYAMLFDSFMMYARYGIYRDIAVTNKPQGDNIFASDYIVNWGQRGRIGEQSIKPRVKFVASRVLPDFFDAPVVIDNLSPPIQMVKGDNWIENLTISPTLNQSSIAQQILKQRKQKKANNRKVDDLSYYEKKLP
jgi:hypothetical protein